MKLQAVRNRHNAALRYSVKYTIEVEGIGTFNVHRRARSRQACTVRTDPTWAGRRVAVIYSLNIPGGPLPKRLLAR